MSYLIQRLFCVLLLGFAWILLEQMSRADNGGSNLPPMPNNSSIVESLKHQFPNDVLLGCSERGKVKFNSAQQLTQPKFLKRHILLEVSVRGYVFPRSPTPPSGSTSGLYAYDGNRLLYLDGPEGKKYLGEILRTESTQIDQIDPIELAEFFKETILPMPRLQSVLQSYKDVEKCANLFHNCAIAKPSVTRTAEHGWTIHFWTLRSSGGCLNNQSSQLFEYTIAVSPQFEITYLEKNWSIGSRR